ncbi:hypothetical protein QJS10_CPB15g00284 [Acorus calamus]|uniref:Uncharacterized protein n=1 Tax=Acorus calamus TaxID=4465 RepID=A0AAV9D7N7_ACOCL|nr:hypothetical protein QJS10_CPB15g00284 [Acorus calamus]
MENFFNSEVEDIFEELGLGRTMSNVTVNVPGISVVFHLLLRELPADIVSFYALNTIQLFEYYKDMSIDQVISRYETLNEYLVTVEAYLDFILQYQMAICWGAWQSRNENLFEGKILYCENTLSVLGCLLMDWSKYILRADSDGELSCGVKKACKCFGAAPCGL